jgi:hypothetical protein
LIVVKTSLILRESAAASQWSLPAQSSLKDWANGNKVGFRQLSSAQPTKKTSLPSPPNKERFGGEVWACLGEAEMMRIVGEM